MAMRLNVDKPKGNRMALEKLDGCELPAAADMHVHLRDGAMTELVVYEHPIYSDSYRH